MDDSIRVMNTIKFIHAADLHLGRTAYAKRDPGSGRNCRAQDLLDRFKDMVDYALDNDIMFILISGDMFDSVRPGFGTVAFVLQQLLRLAERNIGVCIIGGNHDTPKTMTGTSPLEVLSYIPGMTVAYREPYVLTRIPGGDLNFCMHIHMVPFTYDKETFEQHVESCKKELDPDSFNILMLHVAISSDVRMLSFDELILDDAYVKDLAGAYDYIALGHYHGYLREHDQRVVYPGSTERITFNEVNDMDKGFVVCEYNMDSNSLSNMEWVTLPIRPMFELGKLDYDRIPQGARPTDWLLAHIRGYDDRLDGAICRLAVDNVPALVYRAIDFRALREVTGKCLHFDFKFHIMEEHVEYNLERVAFKSIPDEWAEFVGKQTGDIDSAREIGIKHILKVMQHGR